MLKSAVYHRVAALGANKPHYNGTIHARVDELVQQWLERDAVERQDEPCGAYVERQYEHRYGIPVLGLLTWPALSGLIQSLTKNTLDAMFPEDVT